MSEGAQCHFVMGEFESGGKVMCGRLSAAGARCDRHTLLPCPFCGSADVECLAMGNLPGEDWDAGAFCKDERCGADGPYARGATKSVAKAMAIAAWNRRARPEAP